MSQKVHRLVLKLGGGLEAVLSDRDGSEGRAGQQRAYLLQRSMFMRVHILYL